MDSHGKAWPLEIGLTNDERQEHDPSFVRLLPLAIGDIPPETMRLVLATVGEAARSALESRPMSGGALNRQVQAGRWWFRVDLAEAWEARPTEAGESVSWVADGAWDEEGTPLQPLRGGYEVEVEGPTRVRVHERPRPKPALAEPCRTTRRSGEHESSDVQTRESQPAEEGNRARSAGCSAAGRCQGHGTAAFRRQSRGGALARTSELAGTPAHFGAYRSLTGLASVRLTRSAAKAIPKGGFTKRASSKKPLEFQNNRMIPLVRLADWVAHAPDDRAVSSAQR
jgi:hypothetical protein